MSCILVVEDEKNIRLFLERLLAGEGYTVVAFDNGEAALAQLPGAFDLAILDLNLGKGINGMDVLAALRRQTPATAVILLTGYATLETAIEALRQGAHDYLLKPCQANQIRESVRQGLLKRAQTQQQQTLLSQLEQNLSRTLQEIRTATTQLALPPAAPPGLETAAPASDRFLQRSGLLVDLERHVATIDGRLLDLSLLEFNLLVYLVREAPRVVPPQELVGQVHGYAAEAWEASELTRSHIYRLRQKLKAAANRADLIRTVRGLGYNLE